MTDFSAPDQATKGSSLQIKSHNQYQATPLDDGALPSSPFGLFHNWMEAASSFPCAEPEAAALSTATPDGIPSTRFILLKAVDERGFVIFTNYESRKGKELAVNPHASLALYWREMSRQVRIVGRTEIVDRKETADYFATRPIGSKVAAWASPQSSVIPSRHALNDKVKAIEQKFGLVSGSTEVGTKEGSADIPPPDYWGGIRLIPDEIEFWAGRPNRLHDRFVYKRSQKAGSPTWTIERLAP